MYRDGLGVDQDYGKAVDLFRLAADADQQDAEGQFALGTMYRDGLGVAQSDAEAARWFAAAAEQNHAAAQEALEALR